MSAIVGVNGELLSADDAARERINALDLQVSGLVNLLTLLVLQAGGTVTLTAADLVQIGGCIFRSQSDPATGDVVLSVVSA